MSPEPRLGSPSRQKSPADPTAHEPGAYRSGSPALQSSGRASSTSITGMPSWIGNASRAPWETSSRRSAIVAQRPARHRTDQSLQQPPVDRRRAARVLASAAHWIAPSSPPDRSANSISVTSVSRRFASVGASSSACFSSGSNGHRIDSELISSSGLRLLEAVPVRTQLRRLEEPPQHRQERRPVERLVRLGPPEVALEARPVHRRPAIGREPLDRLADPVAADPRQRDQVAPVLGLLQRRHPARRSRSGAAAPQTRPRPCPRASRSAGSSRSAGAASSACRRASRDSAARRC